MSPASRSTRKKTQLPTLGCQTVDPDAPNFANLCAVRPTEPSSQPTRPDRRGSLPGRVHPHQPALLPRNVQRTSRRPGLHNRRSNFKIVASETRTPHCVLAPRFCTGRLQAGVFFFSSVGDQPFRAAPAFTLSTIHTRGGAAFFLRLLQKRCGFKLPTTLARAISSFHPVLKAPTTTPPGSAQSREPWQYVHQAARLKRSLRNSLAPLPQVIQKCKKGSPPVSPYL